MVHPFCGASLEKGTKIAAMFEIFTAAVFLLLNVNALVRVVPLAIDEREKDPNDPQKINSMMAVLMGINSANWVLSLLMAFVLLAGVKQRDVQKCRVWFIMTCILFLLCIIEIFMNAFSLRALPVQILSPVVGTVLQCYMMWIVSEFMKELRFGCIQV